jgi:hypothetical protein
MKTLCPSCPDGNEWGSNGPTGRACPTCHGNAFIGDEDEDDTVAEGGMMSALSKRIRPDVEAAPWVVGEVMQLERENAALRATLAHKDRDRQYHMDAINRLASFLALSGTSFDVVQAAIDNMTRLARDSSALRQKLAEARRAERERCAALCDAEAEMWLTKAATNESRQRHCLARAGAVTRAAERIRALPDEETK